MGRHLAAFLVHLTKGQDFAITSQLVVPRKNPSFVAATYKTMMVSMNQKSKEEVSDYEWMCAKEAEEEKSSTSAAFINIGGSIVYMHLSFSHVRFVW